MENSKWHELSVESENKYSIEDLKFIFSESQIIVKQTFDLSNTIVTRSTVMLSVFITLFTTSFAYIASKINSTAPDYPLLGSAAIMLIYAFVLYFITVKNIKKYDYDSCGNQPKELFRDYFVFNKKGMI